jgi:hypothetical protein
MSGAHPASYPKGTGGSFPGGKAAGPEADSSPPTSAEVKKTWVYTSTPPYVFMYHILLGGNYAGFQILLGCVTKQWSSWLRYRCNIAALLSQQR